ncbi:hypothetical protein [Komagataeibacter kakiaceti]|uniref:hypothetical protein n=1 Tax=Komagataeibacter kakiaceti TaxID=943261 RepID=UPI0011DE0151|nr:hypothetical protein [Komagataeibacter kakiaceti]
MAVYCVLVFMEDSYPHHFPVSPLVSRRFGTELPFLAFAPSDLEVAGNTSDFLDAALNRLLNGSIPKD